MKETVKNSLLNLGEDRLSTIVDFHRDDDTRTWYFFPLEMPLNKEGYGPAPEEDTDKVEWQIWDRFNSYIDSYDCVYDAINESIRLNNKLITGELFNELADIPK